MYIILLAHTTPTTTTRDFVCLSHRRTTQHNTHKRIPQTQRRERRNEIFKRKKPRSHTRRKRARPQDESASQIKTATTGYCLCLLAHLHHACFWANNARKRTAADDCICICEYGIHMCIIYTDMYRCLAERASYMYTNAFVINYFISACGKAPSCRTQHAARSK